MKTVFRFLKIPMKLGIDKLGIKTKSCLDSTRPVLDDQRRWTISENPSNYAFTSQERAGNPNGDATQQCMLALPNVTSVIGYVNKQHPCVAFCKYRYTSASHGRVKQAYGGM